MIKGKNVYWFPVGENRALFVDDYYVAEVKGLRRTLHQPVKHSANPLITGETPWEGNNAALFGSLLHDPIDGLYKSWYHSRSGICLAQSRDGLNWDKPLFDLFPRDGKPTNVVYRGFDPELLQQCQFNLDIASILIMPDDPDPERRYRLFSFQAPMTDQARKEHLNSYGHYVAYSPDGVHWRARREPVLTLEDDPELSDCHTCMYDRLKDRFIAFTKRHILRSDGTGDQGVTQRARGISFSDDFEHWTKPHTCLAPDDHDDRTVNLYCMSGFVYEGMYIGLLGIYYSGDNHPPGLARTKDIQLITSRDGEHWWRAGDRKTFLSPSGVPGDWDAYMVDINSSGPIRRGGELWIYYGAHAYHHAPRDSQLGQTLFPHDEECGAIGLATLRRDGFVSYDAEADDGILTTKPILFEAGCALHVNADVRGELRAEVVKVIQTDAPRTEPAWHLRMGNPVEGFTSSDSRAITDDTLDGVLGWSGGDLERFRGELIVLRFYLKDTSLYSFWIA